MKRRKGIFLVLIGAICWGVGGTVSQKLFQQYGIDVNWLVTVRLLISGGLLLFVHYMTKERTQLIGVLKMKSTAIQVLIFGLMGMLAGGYIATVYSTCHDYRVSSISPAIHFYKKRYVDGRIGFGWHVSLIDEWFRFHINCSSCRCILGNTISRGIVLLYVISNQAVKTIRFTCCCWLGDAYRGSCP